MSNSFQAYFQLGVAASAKRIDPEEPMRILVLGNFSGSRDKDDFANRKVLRVDIDNFEERLEKLAPIASVQVGQNPDAVIEIPIGEIDDFEPDTLYRELPIFSELRSLRKRLGDPKEFPVAAAELNEALSIRQSERKDESDSSESRADASPDPESDADTLQRVLGESASTIDTAKPPTGGIDIQGLINEIVAPYIEPAPDPRQDEYLGHADAAIAGQMRSILRDPSFRQLETSWRGLDYLVSNVTSSNDVQVFILDVTKSELSAAADATQLEDSSLFKKLVTEREQAPFSMIVSVESFGHSADDLILLSRLGAIGAHAGGPIIADAKPSMMELSAWTDEIKPSQSDATPAQENLMSLRSSPVAPWIGLAAPRFLLRLPYGAATSSVESFDFEEINDPIADHDALLWGAASLYIARLLATSYLESGWSMSAGDHVEFSDLYALTYKDDGETLLKACAESYFPERAAETMLSAGLMPMLSFKNRNAVRVMRIQSIALPAAGLAGPWS